MPEEGSIRKGADSRRCDRNNSLPNMAWRSVQSLDALAGDDEVIGALDSEVEDEGEGLEGHSHVDFILTFSKKDLI